MTRLALCCVALTACGPKLLPGTADLTVERLYAARGAKPADFAPLLAEGAEVRRGDQVARGAQGAELLAALDPGGATKLIRHHDVSILVLADGRCLFMQRGEGDRLVKAIELRAPEPSDGTNWQAIYWDKAWNQDEDRARLALVKAMWADDGRYVDFSNDVKGPEAVSTMIGNFRRVGIGTQVIATTGRADSGGGWVMFDWVIKSRLGGRTAFIGFDVMHFREDGKADLDAGFFGTRRVASN